MAILQPTRLTGRIEGIFINQNDDGAPKASDVERLRATFAGLEGDAYASLTRPACVRTKRQYQPGANSRDDGASLVVDMENEACSFPGELIDQHHPGYGKYFVKAAWS